jgi:hypothetical protein
MKCLVVWGLALALPSNTIAETRYQLINKSHQKSESNKKTLQFLNDFNQAKIVRELLPIVDKYLVDPENRAFLKTHLRQYMVLEAPTLQIQGDLITIVFESHKHTLNMRLNLTNSKLYVKGKIINLDGMNSETLTKKLSELKLVSYIPSFSLINEAHAALGLALLAVAGISALIVTVLGIVSSWSKKSCFSRYEDVFRTFETAELNCLNDKASVLISPGSKKLTDTHQYIQKVKKQMKSQRSSHKECKKEVSGHFKYFSFWRKKPCLPKERVGLMCDKMKSLEGCLQEYDDLNVDAISEERLRIKIQDNHQNNQSPQRTGEQQ